MHNFALLNIIEPAGTIWLIGDWLIRVAALFIVPRNRKPSSGTAWLLLIFLFPLLGAILFLILGSPKLPKKRREAQKTLDKVITNLLAEFRVKRDKNKLLGGKVPSKYAKIARLNESLSNLPVFKGNSIEVLPEYDEAIRRITRDIDKAKHYVHLEYFIIAQDETTLPLYDALAAAVQRGVIVRLMYDWLSIKRYPKWREMLRELKEDGIIIQPMLQLKLPGKGYIRPDLRNHRKLVVIDGVTGYTGSQNLIRRDYHRRKDDIYYDELVVRLRGPIVLQLAAVFLTDWYSETGKILDYKDVGTRALQIKKNGNALAQVLPSGPGYEDENNLMLFTDLIHLAEASITIVNPYFVPDDALITAITSAVKRGVKVKMVNSAVMDQWMVGHAQRSFYEVLMVAGVEIYLYNAPILLHSKFMLIDGEVATIGSSNLDIRSFFLDLEVTLIVYDKAVTKKLTKVADKYLKRSKQLNLTSWRKRSIFQQLFDNLARLTSALQ